MVKSYLNEVNHPAEFIECDKSDKGYHILGKLSAPFFDMNGSTRNGRNYSEAAKDALESDTFKELMDNRCFFGRIGHPMTEDESNEDPAVRAAVVMSDYHKNDKTNMYEATLDILDNQYGRQLKSLIDAGCRLGVSTRGSGDSYESANGDEMIRNYEFENLDIVTLPAVKAARVSVVESLTKDKHKKLEDLIDVSNDKYMLESLKVTVESSNMPNKSELLEKLDKKLSGGVETIESLANDITMLTQKLNEAEAKLSESQMKLQESQKSSETIGIENEKKYKESIEKLTMILKSSNKVINDLKLESVESSKKSAKLSEALKKANSNVDKVSKKLESVTKDYEDSIKINKELIESKNSLVEDNKKLTSLNEELNSKLKSTKKLTESEISKSDDKLSKLNESLDAEKSKVSKLESVNKTLTENYTKLISKYIESVASVYGVKLSDLTSKLPKNPSVKLIESTAKSIRTSNDNYKRSFARDIMSLGKKVENVNKSTEIVDPELDRAGRIAQLVGSNIPPHK